MHHGIKGMKWGVRHERDTTGKRTSSQNKKNNDYKKKVLIGAIATAGVLAGIGCLYLSKKIRILIMFKSYPSVKY